LYGSDKSWPSDSEIETPFSWPSKDYATAYDLIWSSSRYYVKNVLELGIGSNNASAVGFMGKSYSPGASLRVWRDYFPNASIVGVDIDPELLFSETRISTFLANQKDRGSLLSLRSELGPTNFDFIVDGGLHDAQAILLFFEAMFELLSPRGYYAVEDIHVKDMPTLIDYFRRGNFNFTVFSFQARKKNLFENNSIIVQK